MPGTFADYVNEYLNKPAGLQLNFQQLGDKLGVSSSVAGSWYTYAMNKNYEYVVANGKPIPDADLINDWNVDHPPVIVIHTPFGDTTRTGPATNVDDRAVPDNQRLVAQMTVAEFKAILGK